VFDDADTIFGRFKLLDSFENLLNRPIIQDELEKKHVVLLEAFKNDLKVCQSNYLDGKALLDSNSINSPIPKNFPPISGSIYWARGILDRSENIMSKISTLGQSCLEREEYKDVQKLFGSLTKTIKEYENERTAKWELEIESTSSDKLKEVLLGRNDNGILLNFDPALTRLLKEVK
jgi:dynein heavy chain